MKPKYRYTDGARRRRRSHAVKVNALLALCAAVITAALLIPAHCSGHSDLNPIDINGNELEHVVTNPALSQVMVQYTGMTVSYNPDLHLPNWVAYELTADEADGSEPRYNTFRADPDVPGCATPDDYRNTGFDRGHIAPAADMKWSPEAMRESFLMTNITPQDGRLNRGAWSKLEEKCRQRARRDSAVIIIAGPVLTDTIDMHIGATGVAVPRRFFKVILSPTATPPVAIGFIMPNSYVEGGMQQCAVSVDSVESVTGHDFFSALPDDIEAAVESTHNFTRWSRML